MYKVFKCALICAIVISSYLNSVPCSAFEYENTADNPRLVNLTPKQHRSLDTIEKRLYDTSFSEMNTVDRIEQLETDIFGEIKTGSITQRLAALRTESTKVALRATPMTPNMNANFNTKYLNSHSDVGYYDDVGLLDGLVRAWWPDIYAQISEYRKYKEANFW